MNTANEAIAIRIFEIKEWLVKHDRQYDNSKVNEQRVKLQLELKKISEKHFEDPFVRIGKAGRGANE